jgi:hypothetical protein
MRETARSSARSRCRKPPARNFRVPLRRHRAPRLPCRANSPRSFLKTIIWPDLHALLPYVQYDGFAAGQLYRLSGPVRKNGPGERRHVGDRAPRGIGLIFTNDPEALLAAVFSAEGDGQAEGCRAFVSRRSDDFRARVPSSNVLPAKPRRRLPRRLCLLPHGASPRNGRERPQWPQAPPRSRNCGEAIPAGHEVQPCRSRLLDERAAHCGLPVLRRSLLRLEGMASAW